MANIYASTHNEAMVYILDRMESLPTENAEAVINGIYGDFCTDRGFPFPIGTLPTFPEDFNDLDPYQLLNQSDASNPLKDEVRRLIDLILSMPPYNPFEQSVLGIREGAQGSLSQEDYELFDNAAVVALQSHQLYIGDGNGPTEFVQNAADKSGGSIDAEASFPWWKVGAVDLIGGAISGGTAAVQSSMIAVVMLA